MSISNLVSNYSSFNQWANSQITDWLKTVDEEILYKETPSSFNTIDFTLQHMLRTQNFWLAFITNDDISKVNWALRQREVGKIMSELNDVSEQMKNKFSSYKESELLETLHLNMPWAKNSLNRFEYIVHIVNHGSFHRGQIVTMARGLGITNGIVNTDYNIYHVLQQVNM